MVALPKAARFPTAEAIYAAYVENNDDTERTYLGASVLGDECERKLWLAFRWAFHPSVSGMSSGSGSSGSTAWNNSVRSRLYLRRAIGGDGIEDDPDLRVLTTKKANYGPIGAEIKMRWADGRFIAENVDEPHQDPSAAKARVDALFLKLLDDYEAEGRIVGAARSANYAPAVFSSDVRAKGVDRRGFEGAMNRLFAEKRIRNVEYGSPSKRRMRLTKCRQEDVT